MNHTGHGTALTAVCGVLSADLPADTQRAQQIAACAETEGVTFTRRHTGENIMVWGTDALGLVEGENHLAAGWTTAGAPDGHQLNQPWPQLARVADACGVRAEPGQWPLVHGHVSGAGVVYVLPTTRAVFFATRLRWLAQTAEQLAPDWQSWAEILAFGAPLGGATTFTRIRRLQPMEYVELTDQGPRLGREHWPWEDYEPRAGASVAEATAEVIEHFTAVMRPHLSTEAGPAAHPMLSGGRDSRLLTALAARHADAPVPVTGWSTSSDTGSALEQIVAADVAHTLGVDHRVVVGRYSEFGRDFAHYADAVDHQASFHVWLMPAARQLAQATPGTVFDGIGGGVFYGGGFADPPGTASTQLATTRIQARSHYLHAAGAVLSADAAQTLTARAAERAWPIARRYTGHPNGHTLTSYLIRTVPGISLAPTKVLGSAQPTVTPMLTDPAIRCAMELPAEAKTDGRWYPELLTTADARLQGVPTADDLLGTHHHKRRIASREGAGYLAQLIGTSPVYTLLSRRLAEADPADPTGLVTWQRTLNSTRPQHLLRGLGMLALWLEDYADVLTDTDPRGVADAG
ncbi:asparagine synthase-related protein [Nesterenkonia alba]|uniref:asparagine synthase-related protein n=1 Tax=Nesterenkonia alba TaxID=515814 RepID=UPI0003B2F196|nr:asparagine synthase-related protein [Nesterenkonia alba]